MTAEEFLQALQIVELTRDQPRLKAVHDWFLKLGEDHADEISKKLEERKKKEEEEAKAEAAKKAEAEKAEAAKAEREKSHAEEPKDNPDYRSSMKR